MLLHDANAAHLDDGHLEPATGFDYDRIDQSCFGVEERKQTDFEGAAALMRRLFEWHFQDGMNNPEGVLIRGAILDWFFVPQLRPLTMVELARGFGKKKQSFGRWVDHFYRTFPEFAPYSTKQRK